MIKGTTTLITGNTKKAEYFKKYLGFPVEHIRLDLDEIQSLDLQEIVEHKVKQAYGILKKPVFVEDTSLSFEAFGQLPGPFIKFFEKELGLERLCAIIQDKNRNAIARCTFGYHDGSKLEFFEGNIKGKISEFPRGENGFGWDKIFIPYFSGKTAAELSLEEYERFYTEIKPLGRIREFLINL